MRNFWGADVPGAVDVYLPTGGFFATLAVDGRAVTLAPRAAIREMMRAQALAAWQARPVQGKIALLGRAVYTPCLDIRALAAWELSGSLSEFNVRYNLSPGRTFGSSDFRTLYLMLLDTSFNIDINAKDNDGRTVCRWTIFCFRGK